MASTPTEIVQAWSQAVHSGHFDQARPLAREDLHFRGPIDAPVAEWYTVEGGKISAVRAYFDARPFAPPAGEAKR